MNAMELNVDQMKVNAHHASKLLSALCNEKRLLILCHLVAGERSVNSLVEALQIRQSTVSQHLALLRTEGLVMARREAQTIYYSLRGEKARALLETLYRLYCAPDSKGATKPGQQQ